MKIIKNMKYSRPSWLLSSQSTETAPIPAKECGFPIHLPVELWRKIIGFTIRITGATTIKLDGPFGTPHLHEEHPEIDFGLFHDQRACRSFPPHGTTW